MELQKLVDYITECFEEHFETSVVVKLSDKTSIDGYWNKVSNEDYAEFEKIMHEKGYDLIWENDDTIQVVYF